MGFLKNIFSLVLLGVIIAAFQSCKNDEGEINRITKVSDVPIESVYGVTVLYRDSTHVKSKVESPVMYNYIGKNPRIELPKGLIMFFYDNEGNVISTLTAKYAIRNEIAKTMEARNDVVVRNKKGEQLNTERLLWNERTGKFSSDAFVKITTATEVIMGEGFEANEDFTKYRILHPKGNITVNKDDTVK